MINLGLIVCLLSPIAFGLLGCLSKIGERMKCNASALVLSLMGWSTLLMLLRSVSPHSVFHIPFKAVIAAVVFGITGAIAYFAFQKSIEIGKVTAGWLMMNLSMGVPAIVSIGLYHEKLTTLKVAAFTLALLALLLLFWGQVIEQQSSSKSRGES